MHGVKSVKKTRKATEVVDVRGAVSENEGTGWHCTGVW
jgi:hypothetical protein